MQAKELSAASSMNADAFTLKLGEGSLSNYIKALKLGKMVRYEYVPSFQLALYAPQPLTTP